MAQVHRFKTDESAEWALRCDLAATFRLSAREKWNEGIGNHNSAMIPGTELMLINPRGMLFNELKATDLIVCDLEGNVVSGKGELRKVAHFIHSRIHLMHPQAMVVLHVHPPYATALSLVEGGRLAMSHNNDLTLNDRIAYDDEMNGSVLDDSEGDRIARLLGKKTTLVMASHGLTTVGRDVASAFCELSAVERSAMWQCLARGFGGPLKHLSEGLRKHHYGDFRDVWDADLEFAAYKRLLDREEPDYAS
jgi:ribulose-5-phosphate 4-epimerase/fuculose-1-phosphate aldolase